MNGVDIASVYIPIRSIFSVGQINIGLPYPHITLLQEYYFEITSIGGRVQRCWNSSRKLVERDRKELIKAIDKCKGK